MKKLLGMLLLCFCVTNMPISAQQNSLWNATAIKQTVQNVAFNVATKTTTAYQNAKKLPVWNNIATTMAPAWEQVHNFLFNTQVKDEFKKHQNLYFGALALSSIIITCLIYNTCCCCNTKVKKKKNIKEKSEDENNLEGEKEDKKNEEDKLNQNDPKTPMKNNFEEFKKEQNKKKSS